MNIRNLVYALSFTFLVGCATQNVGTNFKAAQNVGTNFKAAQNVGTNFKWEDVDNVKNGMTESQVISIFGKPYSRSQTGNKSKLRWVYVDASTINLDTKAVTFKFEDGKVVGQGYVGR
jgi:outer membrane protein assembly factor BamE (lipoprotein component of BamABCDE complex)